jgi:hypothetical protein
MNPYRHLQLPDLHRELKETIAKCREAKKRHDRSLIIKLKKDIGMIKQFIFNWHQNNKHQPYVDPERDAVKVARERAYQENLVKFGFAITSHALLRFRSRYNRPDMTMAQLYEKMSSIPDFLQYKEIFPNGEFFVSDDCVAVLKHKKILTFKNPNQNS